MYPSPSQLFGVGEQRTYGGVCTHMRTYTEKPEGAAGYPVYRRPLNLDPASPEIVSAPAVLALQTPFSQAQLFFLFNMHAGDLIQTLILPTEPSHLLILVTELSKQMNSSHNQGIWCAI